LSYSYGKTFVFTSYHKAGGDIHYSYSYNWRSKATVLFQQENLNAAKLPKESFNALAILVLALAITGFAFAMIRSKKHSKSRSSDCYVDGEVPYLKN
jgi:hypothetical protein